MHIEVGRRVNGLSVIATVFCCLWATGCPDGVTGRSATTIGSQIIAPDGPDGFAGMPADLSWKDASPGWDGPGEKLVLTGQVFKPDGTTPAADVILYYYHTNAEGRYQHRPEVPRSMPPNALGQTHGHLRGWIRTGADGRYEIRTIRPAAYPTKDEPAHIHLTIKEPDLPEYWADDFVFDDDPLLTATKRRALENRCGSGVLRLQTHADVLVAQRDLVLGLNIPHHPRPGAPASTSGRNVAEDVMSFIPFHAWGPDKGSRACPICKYGKQSGVLYFVGTNPDWAKVRSWLVFLEAQSVLRGDRLKVYFIYGNPEGYTPELRRRELEALGSELKLEHVALTFVPSLNDEESEVVHNRIDRDAPNTFLIYRQSRIIAKSVDIDPDEKGFRWVKDALDRPDEMP